MYGEIFRSSSTPDQYPGKHADTVRALRGVGKAAYTLFNVPDHDYSKSKDLAHILEATPQETLLAPEQECENVRQVLSNHSLKATTSLDRTDLLGMTGVMMQFTSYLPELRPYAKTPFEDIDHLYQEIVDQGRSEPLDLSQQLDIALDQTEGDIGEALWRLFVTSRMHGRWYDTSIIQDLPDLSRDTIMNRMFHFSTAIKACKEFDPSLAQDTAGDAYYVWTHALAKFSFHALAEKRGLPERMGARVLHHGTSLMHGLAHRFKEQHVVSDHTAAANYGNAIGAVCVEMFESAAPDRPHAA